MKRYATIILAALAVAGAQIGVADTGYQLHRVVKYGELNLSQPEGVKLLYHRLSQAAREVCAPLESRQLGMRSEHRACMAQALSNAVEQVNQPALTEYYRSLTGASMTRVAAR